MSLIRQPSLAQGPDHAEDQLSNDRSERGLTHPRHDTPLCPAASFSPRHFAPLILLFIRDIPIEHDLMHAIDLQINLHRKLTRSCPVVEQS